MPKFRKYTEEIREKIKKDYLSGMSLKEISARYSIDSRRIAEIAKTITTIPDIEEKPKMKVQYNNEIKSEDSVKTINNTSTVEYTVEQLLNKNGYSPNEWEVTSVNSNTWDDSAGVTHHQTKINIVKKVVNIELQLPSKIQVNLSANPPRKLRGNGNLKCALILPDMQCGFRRNINNGSLVSIHDREAMDVALQIAHYLDPDRIVLLGDNLDLAEMSLKYSVPSDMYFTTQASLVELSWWLSKFRCINESTKIDYLEGNHEGRMNRLLSERAISAFGLKSVNNLKGNSALSVQNLLSLDDLDIEYHSYPNGKVALNSNLVCIHGEVAKGQSGATVSELVKSARVSVIQGHIHRHEVATKTTWDAYDNFHMYTAASFGCLCKLDPGIVPGMKHLQNWQQGVGVVWYEEDGLEQFRTEFIPIINGRAIYTSEIFEAESEDKIAMTIEKEMKFKVT